VFTADIKGDFIAFDARSGRIVWRHDTGRPIGSGVISHAIGGQRDVRSLPACARQSDGDVDGPPAKIIAFTLP